ncbi:hypothetical protein [Nonomuraea cavernae]|uniref:Uncharacterized protein n=1 Tax=Nonomuraea cavernae TaxID=2045107 RepID=A0A917Z953_9ACTN|nr:hypothetical protein [Nonomuraea cavernae]MCA2189659.1 hypothetical protein [Nonomuraea cavernae]GGO77451.1 hypothetical protein GCM10012289_57160 [Nonomuraea cavernae]
MHNGVRFSERTVAAGIGVWKDMAGVLKKEWDSAASEIEDHMSAAPWGQGMEGLQFQAALMRSGGPLQMVRSGREIIDQIVQAGSTLHLTISNSVATDQAEAARINRLLTEI